MTQDELDAIKSEIIAKLSDANAYSDIIQRIDNSITMAQLCDVIKCNFAQFINYKVIDAKFITRYQNDFADNEIYANVDTSKGFVLCDDNAVVWARDNAAVWTRGNAEVRAGDNTNRIDYDNRQIN